MSDTAYQKRIVLWNRGAARFTEGRYNLAIVFLALVPVGCQEQPTVEDALRQPSRNSHSMPDAEAIPTPPETANVGLLNELKTSRPDQN